LVVGLFRNNLLDKFIFLKMGREKIFSKKSEGLAKLMFDLRTRLNGFKD